MKKLLAAAALAALSIGSANAATVTQSAPLVLDTTEINQSFSFNQFDASLGTLTSVLINLDGRAISSASFENNAAQAQNFSFASTLNLFLDNAAAGISDQLSLELFNYPRQLTDLGLTDLGSVDKTDTLSLTAANLAAFIGNGTTTFTCESGVSNTQNGGGGNIVVTQSTSAGCGLSVVYTYDVPTPPPANVPEPASMALVGLGMMGLAAIRRRK
jgi:opacity protein-like surface antigen